jgi:creatinine amidohydrolase/Fe(II)-dependent formamide hydrolase-like protein
LPELIDMSALRPGRDDSAWPNGQLPDQAERHPGVSFDPNDPLFAQLGADARLATAERGEAGIARLVDHVSRLVMERLAAEER